MNTEHTARRDFLYASPIGDLGGYVHHGRLSHFEWLNDKSTHSEKSNNDSNDSVIRQIVATLDEYFDSGVMRGDIPLLQAGTDLQKAVWGAIAAIPSGSVQTYSDIAKQIKNHPRSVGGACKANRHPLFIPCHRVIGKNNIGGYIGGYNRQNIDRKRWLLQHEGYF